MEGLFLVFYFGSKFNMLINYLSDMFKKEIGRSIKEYIDGYIIDWVKFVLFSINKKVSEIVYDLGFNYF